jgi:hypothetical protein
MMAFSTRNQHATMLSRYYWDTIAECVPPESIVDALERSGFVDVRRRVFAGLMSEYTGTRPVAPMPSADGHLGGRDATKPIPAQKR